MKLSRFFSFCFPFKALNKYRGESNTTRSISIPSNTSVRLRSSLLQVRTQVSLLTVSKTSSQDLVLHLSKLSLYICSKEKGPETPEAFRKQALELPGLVSRSPVNSNSYMIDIATLCYANNCFCANLFTEEIIHR